MQPTFRRRFLKTAAAAAVLMATGTAAFGADGFPAKPITLIVPFAPGGTTDIVAREIAHKMGQDLGQTIVVDNRPGAGGTLGAGIAARSGADGYTLFLATVAHTMAPGIYKKLAYDFTRDFDPIGMAATTPNVLVVHPSLPVKSVAELIAYSKANPGKVNFGSAGSGSTEHFSGELFRTMTGADAMHVPYKGGAPMMNDLVGGQIQMAIETSASASTYVRSGRVKALAVTSPQPSPAYPGVPTMEQAGVKGYNVITWFSLMAPHGTPAPVEQRIAASLDKALKAPDLQKRFEELGVSPGNMDAKNLTAFIRTETARWTKVAKQANIQVD